MATVTVNDFDPLPRVTVRIAETPEEIAQAEHLAKRTNRDLAHEKLLSGMDDATLIEHAMCDEPENLLALELAHRLNDLHQRCSCVGFDPESVV